MSGPPNPPVRRVVTGHTPEGKSVVLDDADVPPHPFIEGSATYFTDVYWSEGLLAENALDYRDLAKEHSSPKDLVNPNGSNLRVVEMPPGAVAPLHRTVTLDYGIVMKGKLTLVLDDDKRVVLNPGDVIVQRGTIHGWLNEGTEWTRVYFVMLASQKVKIGDKELEAA